MSSDRAKGERSDGELFAAAAAAVARSDDLDDALAQLLGLAGERAGATKSALFILDADGDELSLAVSAGVPAEVAAELGTVSSFARSEDALAVATRSRKPMPFPGTGQVALFGNAKSAYVVPLVVRRDGIEVALGTMALGFAGELPGAPALAFLEPLADLAAVAVERALTLSLGSERAEWFDRLAHIDLLTGLANRRTAESIMELELARAGRQGAPMSVAIFSIDQWDEIQTAGGAAAADLALRRVAQVLSESVRLVDTVARYDADEFLLLAPGPDGLIATERLVAAVNALEPLDGRKLSVSAGMASFPIDGRAPDELVEVAGRSMLKAREAGGGQVVAESPAAD